MRGSQPLAAFGAAALKHELAALGAHAHAESVSLRSAAIVRLKSPSHTIHLSINVSA